MLRRSIQSVLALPAFVMAPIGWAVLARGHSAHEEEMLRQVYPDRTAWSVGLPIAYFCVSSALGLAALLASIISDPKKEKGRFRWAMVFGLAIGVQLDLYMLLQAPSRHTDVRILAALLLLGPLIVAVWNLSALLRTRDEEPNKAPEPTPLPVTIPAEPGIAPGSGVAHL